MSSKSVSYNGGGGDDYDLDDLVDNNDDCYGYSEHDYDYEHGYCGYDYD